MSSRAQVVARSRSIGSRRRLRAFAAVSVIATGVAFMVGAAGASAAPAPPDVIYTTATDGTTFATLDSLTGAGTLLGSTGRAQGWAVAMDTDGTMWTTINGFGAAQIATVDKVTGQATPVGSPIGAQMIALEIAPDGTMYGIGYQDRRLYRINKATGAGTLIGADTGIAATMDLAFDCAGRLWATAMGNMWTVDPATGNAVARPSITGVTEGAISVMGLMVDRSCRMYVTTYTSPSSMYELDPATGSATLIGVTGLACPHGGSAGLVVDQAGTDHDRRRAGDGRGGSGHGVAVGDRQQLGRGADLLHARCCTCGAVDRQHALRPGEQAGAERRREAALLLGGRRRKR